MTAEVAQRDFTGRLLPQTLSDLQSEHATGTLRTTTLTATRDVLFVDGEIRATRSTAETEKLGSWLVSKGVITEVFKQSALLSQEGSDSPPLGHILVEKGITSKETLENHLENLALTILERASSDTHRRCVFLDRLGSSQLDTLPQIATPQLILIAARAAGDSEATRSALGSEDNLVARRNSLDAIVQEFQLHVPEAVILGKLHRGRTVADLRRISSLEDPEFYASAYALKAAGIIEILAKPTRAVTVNTTTFAPASEGPQNDPDSPIRMSHSPATNPEYEQEAIKKLFASMKTANHYEFFGLNRHASYQDIFDAWEVFQEKFSPQRASEPHLKGLSRKLKAVYEHGEDAFEVLSSPVKRPRYEKIISTSADTEANVGLSSRFFEANPAEARASLVAHNLRKVDKLVRTGDMYSAVSLLEQTCDLDPQPASLLKLAKLMLLNPNWVNRALEKLRRAVEIDPTFVDGWLAVADFWGNRNNSELERKAVERALAADPDNAQTVDRYRRLRGPAELQAFLARVRGKGA